MCFSQVAKYILNVGKICENMFFINVTVFKHPILVLYMYNLYIVRTLDTAEQKIRKQENKLLKNSEKSPF